MISPQYTPFKRVSTSHVITYIYIHQDDPFTSLPGHPAALVCWTYRPTLYPVGLFEAVSIDSSDVAWSRDDNSFNKVYEEILGIGTKSPVFPGFLTGDLRRFTALNFLGHSIFSRENKSETTFFQGPLAK